MKEKQIINDLVDFLSTEIVDKTIIDGGHYLLEEIDGKVKHLLNPESTLTFKAAVALFKKSKEDNKKVALAFLVGDLSFPPEKRKKMNEEFRLPPEYIKILKENKVDPSEVNLFFEANLRNKASRKIKSSIKKNEAIEVGESYRMNFEKFGISCELSSENLDKSKRVPVCRMIIAQELLDKEFSGYNKALNFCNADVYKCIGKFASVYQFLLRGKMEVINIYFYKENEKLKIIGDRYNKRTLPERIFSKIY